MKIHWKLIIYQNFRVVFQISRPGNIPQKWFSTQNEPLGVTFQMRLTPTMEASNFWRNQAKSTMHPFKNTFKGCTMLSVWFFKKMKAPMVWVLCWVAWRFFLLRLIRNLYCPLFYIKHYPLFCQIIHSQKWHIIWKLYTHVKT